MKTIQYASVLAIGIVLGALASSWAQHRMPDQGVDTKVLYEDEYVRFARLVIQPRRYVRPHTHPGDETGYVAKGSVVWAVRDGPCTPLQEGKTLAVRAETTMTVTNNTDDVVIFYSLIAGLHGKEAIQDAPGKICE
jgi:quercetin dioxygenase-like cupin family protein